MTQGGLNSEEAKPPVAPVGICLGIDFGRMRHGVAVSDGAGILATPLTTVDAKPQPAAVAALAQLAQAHAARALVVGLPLSKDGTENEMTREIRSFAGRLAQAARLPVHFSDERYTTEEALEQLRERGMSIDAVKGKKDAWAAAVILQDYLDSAGKAKH